MSNVERGVILTLLVSTFLLGLVIGSVRVGVVRTDIEQSCLKKGYTTINESVYKCSLDKEIEATMLIKKSGEM